jgi:putative oxidoreductase
MLVAAFIIHGGDGFGKQELPLHYILVYLVLLIAGAGKFSLDNWIFRKIN